MRRARLSAGVLVGAFLAVSLAGCGQDYERLKVFLQEPRRPVAAIDYHVLPPDAIQIMSEHVPDINGARQQVRPDGKINLPLIGEVYVADLTPLEIEEAIKKKAREYYEQVDATVQVVEYRSQKIYVFGQVSRPGPVPYTGADTLVDILATVQPTPMAWLEQIHVVRGKEPVRGGYVPTKKHKHEVPDGGKGDEWEPPCPQDESAPGADKPSPAPGADKPSTAPAADKPSPAPSADKPSPAPAADKPSTAPGADKPSPAPAPDKPSPAPGADKPSAAPSAGEAKAEGPSATPPVVQPPDQPEAKPDAKAEPKTETKADAKPAPATEGKAETPKEPTPETAKEPKAEAKPEPSPQEIALARANIPLPHHPKGTLMKINLRKMMHDGDMTHNVFLKPDDVVYVPPNPLAAVGLALQQLLFPILPAAQAVSAPASAAREFSGTR
jgi:hypothetical protein